MVSMYNPIPYDTHIQQVQDAYTVRLDAVLLLKKYLIQGLFPAGDAGIPALRFPDFADAPPWKSHTLSEICKIKQGRSQKEVEALKGEYPILASGGCIGMARKYLYNKPSVLIGRKGTIGKPMYMTSPFWAVDTLFYTKINQNEAPKWLFYLFHRINWRKYNEGSAVPSLIASSISRVPITRPSLDEQERVAAALTAVDDLIETIRGVISVWEQFKRSPKKRKERTMKRHKAVLSEMHIDTIMDVILIPRAVARFAKIATPADTADNAHNLNISRYVDTFVTEPRITRDELIHTLTLAQHHIAHHTATVEGVLSELGFTAAEINKIFGENP